ncbi:hypothetical protein, partial [Shewanella algae]
MGNSIKFSFYSALKTPQMQVCEHCGGHVKVIASIEDPKVIEQILKHLKQKTAKANAAKQRELPPE